MQLGSKRDHKAIRSSWTRRPASQTKDLINELTIADVVTRTTTSVGTATVLVAPYGNSYRLPLDFRHGS